MIRTTITFLLMIILFLVGVLIGFDKAGEGMDKIRGNDQNTYDAVQVNKVDDSYEVVEVLGQSVEQESLEDKKAEYQDIKEDYLSEKIAVVVESGVKWFFNLIVQGATAIAEIFYKA